MSVELTTQNLVNDIVATVKDLPILKEEDVKFLMANSEHLNKVLEKTHIWRTDTQKMSIINDVNHPTKHSKFHQAILEQKVQFEQSMYLAKDFEIKKLDAEELVLDIDALGTSLRDDIKKRKLTLELKFKQFELKQQQIAMKFRLDEVKGWQRLQEGFLEDLRKSGMSEEDIWNKDSGALKAMFFSALNHLQSLPHATDTGERSNIIAAANFVYQQVKANGLLEEYRSLCNLQQKDSLDYIEKQK